jgi:hypothetical protein
MLRESFTNGPNKAFIEKTFDVIGVNLGGPGNPG